MRALVIANTGDDDPGYVGERLVYHGYELDIRHRDGTDLPAHLEGYDLVVMLGSDWSVYWEHVGDHVARESALIREAAATQRPTLAICYGAQLMSHALGGSVQPARQVEIGWYDIVSRDHELAPPGPWFQYHVDSFTPPPGAQVIAESSAGPQAYRLGAMLALQFHPEVSTRIVRRWGESGTAEAAKHGLDFEAIIGQSEALDAQSRERCHRLVDAFLVGLVS